MALKIIILICGFKSSISLFSGATTTYDKPKSVSGLVLENKVQRKLHNHHVMILFMLCPVYCQVTI